MDDRNDVPARSPAIEKCVEEEVLEWYRMTPLERWEESMRLWSTFRLIGGRLRPDPAIQTLARDAQTRGASRADGRTPVRVIRRGGV